MGGVYYLSITPVEGLNCIFGPQVYDSILIHNVLLELILIREVHCIIWGNVFIQVNKKWQDLK